ncbi:hypothetical protein ARMA_0979 [Ardenticatena maritima]|uniref:C553-type monoheme cytochrome c n=1 Tax=Ardenticatena maritima TaxID=872965 RepID=A0A0M8K8P2_9CHLR|nr:hypothetical protein [Ardenticatena maritima]KPL89533.1 C553-type monoheme cytochrome c [Ardenticatena maritima]GAP62556.1 hypothetical protein ARMA_0979 [Ardenticatena maritima]
MTEIEKLLGPRPPREVLEQERLRFLLPTVLLGLAAFVLIVSIFQPYWRLKLFAPQYPQGLQVYVYVNRLEGDVQEIDTLNHYIGMRPLEEAASLERSLSIFIVGVISLLVIAAIYVHNQYAALLSLPALLFPFIFIADMYYWMRNFGQNLDPHAPLRNAIKPFVPPIYGEGYVGQFKTIATFENGFYLALLASILILAGLYFHREAYKPLVEQMQRANQVPQKNNA